MLLVYFFSTSEGGLPKDPLKEDCGPDVAQVVSSSKVIRPPKMSFQMPFLFSL